MKLVGKFHLKSTHEVIALKKLASNNELTESLYCYASIEEGVKSYLIENHTEDKYFIFLDGVEDLKQRNHHTQLSIIVLAITVLATEKNQLSAGPIQAKRDVLLALLGI